jgi:surface carbohydrate biosynthesis protein
VWLGVKFLENGHDFVIGPNNEVRNTIHKSQPTTYIYKVPRDTDSGFEFVQYVKSAGCKYFGLDTEGGLFNDMEEYAENKNKVMNLIDLYFTWGEVQAKMLREKTGADNIRITGNPRFEILGSGLRDIYKKRGDDLQERFGPYVLVCTNFTWANPYDSEKLRKRVEKLHGDFDRYKYIHHSELFHRFISEIYHTLSLDSEFNVIIRPHPSESYEIYRDIAKHHDRVYVKPSGDVRHWIFGSHVTIHNGSTTGIESLLMRTPVIAYMPTTDDEYDMDLPNNVSERIFDRDRLMERLDHYTTETYE